MELTCMRVIFVAVLLNLLSKSVSVQTVVYSHFDEDPLGLLNETLFIRRLRTPRVVIVKWKCTPTTILSYYYCYVATPLSIRVCPTLRTLVAFVTVK